MKDERSEVLLERIAIAIERLADAVSGGRGVSSTSPVQSVTDDSAESTAEPETDHGESKAAAFILESFLESRGISIKVIPPQDPADQVIDRLSACLGERYDALSGLLAKIKRSMQRGQPITESLKGSSQADVSSVCQFCTRLYEVAFLEQYKYFRSPTYLIKAKTTVLPTAQRFFAGQWLERFILQKTRDVHAQIAAEVDGQVAFEYLINPQIILTNGDDFEMDLLVVIGESIYWIEAKSGDYQQHVSKYSKFARTLGLDYKHSLMVLTDVPEEQCDALSSLFAMTVCNLQTFEEKLLSVDREDTAQRGAAADGLTPAAEL